ncbi:unnamed protein product, partial [Gulo gulo]
SNLKAAAKNQGVSFSCYWSTCCGWSGRVEPPMVESEPLTMSACCNWKCVFQYETNKVLRIQSVNYGSVKWILHILVFSYISFALISDKRYQKKEPVISSVHTKVKGIAEVKAEILENGMKKMVSEVFDTADYTFPLQGNSFFVMTNFLKTEGQQQGKCPDFPTRRTICSSDKNCEEGRTDPQSKGPRS